MTPTSPLCAPFEQTPTLRHTFAHKYLTKATCRHRRAGDASGAYVAGCHQDLQPTNGGAVGDARRRAATKCLCGMIGDASKGCRSRCYFHSSLLIRQM